jgi:hypothetical protein
MSNRAPREQNEPSEFSLVYTKLQDRESIATVVAVEELREGISAAAEVARFVNEATPPFTTFFSS